MSSQARPAPTITTTGTSESGISDGDLAELLNEERDEPPPYTPGPNPTAGETSLEFGPHRPFQQPPPVQPIHFLSPQSTGWNSPQNTGWSSPVQNVARVSGTLPPPTHPSRVRQNTATVDFYHTNHIPPWNGDSGHARISPSAYTPPPGQPPATPSSSYAPPPGQPPTANNNEMQRSQSQRVQNDSSDGRPTTTPMPGHPLLRDNKILVYPMGYHCSKCDNTGFKAYDPSQPCRKCWDKYAKPYHGAIAYAPILNEQSRANGVTGNFQKPLPAFKPPQHNHNPPPSSPGLRNSWSGYPGASSQVNGPPGGYPMGLSPPAPHPINRSVSMGFTHRPPPGAIVVQPGDPRIGGRLCWRCNGSGIVSFLIFDEDTCSTCNGTGRTFC